MMSVGTKEVSITAFRTQEVLHYGDFQVLDSVAATPAVLYKSTRLPVVRHSRSRSAPESYFLLISEELTRMGLEVQQVNAVEEDKKPKSGWIPNHAFERGGSQAPFESVNGHKTDGPEAQELIDEINFLEGEIADLERSVLALYRGFFNRRFLGSSSTLCPINKKDGQEKICTKEQPAEYKTPKKVLIDSLLDIFSVTPTTQSRSSSKTTSSPVQGKIRHAPMLCETTEVARDSQILVSQTREQPKASHCNAMKYATLYLDEDGPRALKDYLSDSLNRLSEDLVLCMANIYCKLSDPPSNSYTGIPESPVSCASSSTSLSSIHGMFSDGWSPGSRAESSQDTPLVDPFHVKGKLGSAGSYNCMVEIPSISVDKDRLNHASRMLREFRLMVERLEKADPSHLSHSEKLAFWINVYNALYMHAYLAYGIPRNNLKRMSLLQKASYKVGGYSVNAYMIEHYILRCRSHRPTQWLQNLLSPATKFKSGDGRRMFAIDRSEPLVCFALCCGARSDPAVRVYTAKNVHEELESSMREFLQASIGFQNNRKVVLPRVVEWYGREAAIPSTSIIEWVSKNVSEQDKDTIQRCIHSRPHRSASHCIDWVPYNFSFRYILDRSLTMKLPFHMR